MEKIAVRIPNKYISEAVQKHQLQVYNQKWMWSKTFEVKDFDLGSSKNICIGIEQEGLQHSSIGWFAAHDYLIISADEYFKNHEKYCLEPVEPLKVAGYEVRDIDKYGFRVGSQFVNWEQYDAIGKLRPKQ